MYEPLFTAARAEQHRAQLMDEAHNSRAYRHIKNARKLRLRLAARRGPQSTARPVTAPVRLAKAV